MIKDELEHIQELIDIMEINGPGFSRAIPDESRDLIITALQNLLLMSLTLQMENDLPKVIINKVQYIPFRFEEKE